MGLESGDSSVGKEHTLLMQRIPQLAAGAQPVITQLSVSPASEELRLFSGFCERP